MIYSNLFFLFWLEKSPDKLYPVIIGFRIYWYIYNTWDVNEFKQFELDTFQLLTVQFITIQYVDSTTRSFINKKSVQHKERPP